MHIYILKENRHDGLSSGRLAQFCRNDGSQLSELWLKMSRNTQDDCTRMKVIALYPRKTSRNSVDFLINRVMEDLPFPIQRIQTDRGREWFAYEFQEALMDCHIKFRPIKPFLPI